MGFRLGHQERSLASAVCNFASLVCTSPKVIVHCIIFGKPLYLNPKGGSVSVTFHLGGERGGAVRAGCVNPVKCLL